MQKFRRTMASLFVLEFIRTTSTLYDLQIPTATPKGKWLIFITMAVNLSLILWSLFRNHGQQILKDDGEFTWQINS